MKVKVKLDNGAKMPTKAHDLDAGFDIYTPIPFTMCGNEYFTVDTGVHIEIPKGYVGFIKSKSGLNVNCELTTEGVIDSGYTGSIKVKIYNNGHRRHYFKEGDKITQLVILPIPEVELVEVDSLAETERGDNGFGSTGR